MDFTKVVVVARGRTGSTAITDELGKLGFSTSLQEVFTAMEVGGDPLLHFNAWRMQRQHKPAGEADQARAYLDEVERWAAENGRRALFWKALSQHFIERPYLGPILAERQYKAVVLKRHPTRTAISGLVATQRGAYNSKVKLENLGTCRLDVAQFVAIARNELSKITHDTDMLERLGISYTVVSYEDYLADRAKFFRNIFEKLSLPVELPAPSDFVVMIDDVEKTVENYAEIKAAAAALGCSL